MIARLVAIMTALYLAFTARPTHATCPPRWWLSHGVDASGTYRCSAPLEDGCEDDPQHLAWVPCAEPAHYDLAIYCTGGSYPIVVDSNTVGCTR